MGLLAQIGERDAVHAAPVHKRAVVAQVHDLDEVGMHEVDAHMAARDREEALRSRDLRPVLARKELRGALDRDIGTPAAPDHHGLPETERALLALQEPLRPQDPDARHRLGAFVRRAH